MTAIILIRLQAGKEGRAVSEIKNMKDITKVEAVFGRWDLVVTADSDSLKDLTGMVINKIRNIDGVSLTETLITTEL